MCGTEDMRVGCGKWSGDARNQDRIVGKLGKRNENEVYKEWRGVKTTGNAFT